MTGETGAARPAEQAEAKGLEPTRDPRVTLVELVDTLLNRGLYLNIDAIISVADIPLIGLNLRATLAGMETMLEYGMMREWDRSTREWVQKTAARGLPMGADEQLIAKMAGGHFHDGDFHRDWRPGSLYLTSERLIAFRRDPQEILWQAPLKEIQTVEVHAESTIGSEDIDRLFVMTEDGAVTVLSASSAQGMRDLILKKVTPGRRAVEDSPGRSRIMPPNDRRIEESRSKPLREGHLWHLQEMASRSEWRGGHAELTTKGFTWKAALERRPAVRLSAEAIEDVGLSAGSSPSPNESILRLESSAGTQQFAGADAEQWAEALHEVLGSHRQHHDGTESDDASSDR